MIIKGNKVIIRAIEKKDLEFLKEIINSPELELMENGFNFPVSSYGQELWYEGMSNFDRSQRMIIEYDGKAIGYTCIVDIDWKNRVAHTGIKIFSDEHRGKGLGKDAVMAIMRFCFYDMNLHKLTGYMIDYNKASLKLYVDKCGWKQEGIKRKEIFKNGTYHDLVIVGILKEEYDELINNLER